MKRKYLLLPTIIIIAVLLFAACSKQTAMPTRESYMFKKNSIKQIKTTENTKVRAGAGDQFKTLSSLNKNELLNVYGRFKNWYVVQYKDRQLGFVPEENTQPVVEKNQNNPDQNQEQVQSPLEKPNTVNQPVQNLTDLEKQMVDLVNGERKKQNAKPLTIDSALTRLARMKAQDMVKNNYFSHYSPTYGSPFDMMDNYGIQYLQAAENIAANSSVSGAHQSLMNSTGHRKNILNPAFTNIGIGIQQSDKYGYIFVQMFTGK